MLENEKQEDFTRQENPNWQFIGKLKDISVFEQDGKIYSWIKTQTTFFVIDGFIKEAVHAGQTVKLSKRDNAAKIGAILVYRPLEEIATPLED